MVMSKVEILRAACCVAGLDGYVCDREHPLLNRLAELAGVGGASLQAMIDRAERDQNFYQEQFDALSADPELTIRTLLAVAAADRELSLNERVVLHHFATKLGLPDERFEQVLEEAEKRAGNR